MLGRVVKETLLLGLLLLEAKCNSKWNRWYIKSWDWLKWTKAVVLKFKGASEPPEGFVKTQAAGLYPRGSHLPGLGQGPRICFPIKLSGDVDAPGPTLVCYGLDMRCLPKSHV